MNTITADSTNATMSATEEATTMVWRLVSTTMSTLMASRWLSGGSSSSSSSSSSSASSLSNQSGVMEKFISSPYAYVNESASSDSFNGWRFPCTSWQNPQHLLFQLANACFCVAYLAPNGRYGVLFLHGSLILAFLLFSTWAWNIICAADVFSWNFSFMIVNMGQTLYILYTMRQVKFPSELEAVYLKLFQPLQVSRLTFKKMVSSEYAQMTVLHAGEAYAMQNLTKTDRLGLLISGKVNVMTDHHFLHHILPNQFLDSPEFESSKAGVDEKFKVSIVAAAPCRYLFWHRQNLEYLLVKEAHLATVFSLVVARDITNKLYAMNDKIVTEKGSHLDIRLPSVTSSMASHVGTEAGPDWRSPSRSLRSKSLRCNSLTRNSYAPIPVSPNNSQFKTANDSIFDSQEKLMDSPVVTVINPEDNIIQ